MKNKPKRAPKRVRPGAKRLTIAQEPRLGAAPSVYVRVKKPTPINAITQIGESTLG